MSPLAGAVYEILRERVKSADDPRITYAELARDLKDISESFEHITHRSQELYAALCEVGDACKKRSLPPLPALVVRADTKRPGDAYYEGMPFKYRDERVAAWQRDLEAVRKGRFPALTPARRASEGQLTLARRASEGQLATAKWINRC
ncbi:MAG: hypothetical protein L0Y72_22675 [Gemmataceae bacterium]|nr:hypothetical protein [Gemmataceae bacterium]MCI0741849.1 hypothetical protein [Gemmataceae bacterium]